MRKIVPECRALDSTPIKEIALDPRMRDDMSAVLKGLQCVYCTAESRAALFTILKAHFQPDTRKDVGRPGMDLWRVIVFAIVKQCLDLDYDALLYRANNDLLLRELLGHGDAGFDDEVQQTAAGGQRAAFDAEAGPEGDPIDSADGAQGGWEKVWGRASRSLRFQGG